MTFDLFQDKVRSQDSVFVMAGVTGSVKGRELAWKFLKENWPTLNQRYEGGFLLSRLVKVSLPLVVSLPDGLSVQIKIVYPDSTSRVPNQKGVSQA